ncbi:hypothetical protein WJX73_005206 [Symbiochloris irregularis]|uniref:Protein kinase domain-containing protein n=1 Tax=Symbiochloris irregularis TaxID=706552 RepID=A0AAW1NLB5_9CHLO
MSHAALREPCSRATCPPLCSTSSSFGQPLSTARLWHHGTAVPSSRQSFAHRPQGRRIGGIARAASAPAVLPKTLPPSLPKEWEAAYERLSMERGYCTLSSSKARYTPANLAARALAPPNARWGIVQRAAQMTFGIGRVFALLALDKLTGQNNNRDRVRLRAAQLRTTLTDLGPSFIKLGQVLASRPDIVREDYMEELCVLQDDVPSFPDPLAFAMMEEDLGQPLGAVFSSISESPIAAASLGQVYKAVLRDTGENVAIKVQRPGVEPLILRDLYVFRALARLFNPFAQKRLGCNAELIVDEFAEKLLEELDYRQEARNIEDFNRNFKNDPKVKIPWVRRDLCGGRMLVMEWIEGLRCTNPQGIRTSGIDVDEFIRCGVVSGMRQLLEFGLFHGDPHPGNIFCLPDGRIAYVDFGNVAELSQQNKAVLIDAVVHAVNNDYDMMAQDFIKLGFLSPGTDTAPIVPALEKIWKDSMGKGLADFNFRSVTSKFNELVFEYPIRIPERYALVIRSLLTQEGVCLTLSPEFHFLEVAYPYVARRLLTDEDPALRQRLVQVLFQHGKLQWARLENLVKLAQEGSGGLDLSDTVRDGARVVLLDDDLRRQLLLALTENDRLHVEEVAHLYSMVQNDINPQKILTQTLGDLPALSRSMLLAWSEKVLTS